MSAVFASANYQLFAQTVPTVQLMGEIAILALVTTLICFLLLVRHRNDNINMSSSSMLYKIRSLTPFYS